jgi:hypothetical protein
MKYTAHPRAKKKDLRPVRSCLSLWRKPEGKISRTGKSDMMYIMTPHYDMREMILKESLRLDNRERRIWTITCEVVSFKESRLGAFTRGGTQTLCH